MKPARKAPWVEPDVHLHVVVETVPDGAGDRRQRRAHARWVAREQRKQVRARRRRRIAEQRTTPSIPGSRLVKARRVAKAYGLDPDRVTGRVA